MGDPFESWGLADVDLGEDRRTRIRMRRPEGAKYSIIFPHKRTEINDEALALNLAALDKFSLYPHEIIVALDPDGGRIDPYRAWNIALDYATTPWFVFHNTDIVVGPQWDGAFLRHAEPSRILTNYLVEPGALGCYERNIHRNFGMCPRCFRFSEWEQFVTETYPATPDVSPGMGFYIQALLPLDMVKACGRFPDDVPFMHRPNDAILFERMEAAGAKHFRVRSFAYHFQNFTARRSACACYQQKSSRPGEEP